MNKKSVEISKNNEKLKLKPTKKEKTKMYLGYTARIFICLISFVLCISTSAILILKSLKVEEAKLVNYKELGSLDYKVYLKPNEFYEAPYLGKDLVYIASLIQSINIDLNYQFIIEEQANMNFTYDVIGKLSIIGNSGKNTLYEKDYVLMTSKTSNGGTKNIHSIKDSLSIDYDYYNEIANSFKQTYGVDATSEFTVYVRINKNVSDQNLINVSGANQMSLTIPLSQRTLNIKLNDTGINSTRSIVKEPEKKSNNIVFIVIGAILFIVSVAALLKLLELLFLLIPKTSKYDKHIKKILTEYDRLIVETPTEPILENKEIIKINRFEELLDARDNLRRPIMYHNLIKHQKCYFYIEKENTIYLLMLKEADIDPNKDKVKPKKK